MAHSRGLRWRSWIPPGYVAYDFHLSPLHHLLSFRVVKHRVVASAEGKDVRLRACFKKGHHHGAVTDLALLANELVHASSTKLSVSTVVGIDSPRAARGLSVESD